MGNYFSQFHNILYPHISVRRGKTIPDIYNEIFSWTIPADKQLVDCSGNKTPYYSGPQVTRWTTNKEELPLAILLQAANNPDKAVDTYAAIFRDIMRKELQLSGQSIEMLDSDMEQFLNAFPITFFDMTGEVETDKRYYPPSYALVTALIYDRICNDGRSKKNRLVETEICMAFLDVLEACQKNNIIFSTPFLLNVLFQENYLLLQHSLDKVSNGLSKKWHAKVQEYVEMETHRPYAEMRLGDQEIIFFAELLAIQDHYLDPHCPASATEDTICRSLPLCRKSKTATEMWAEIVRYGVDQDEWNEIVRRSRVELCLTTAPTSEFRA